MATRAGEPRSVSITAAQALAADLRHSVQGEVRFDRGSRALYATDASNYRQVPIGVVIPHHVDDVVAAVAVCREHGAPILSRGCGTSLAGQCCNAAVVIDISKYVNRVVELDPKRKLARVQPGVILDQLRDEAKRYDLTFGPDPATHSHCTLGGMIGNNSCGVHSLMAGKTDDNIEAMEILLYDGTRMRVGETSEAELEHIIAEGGRRGEIYRRLKVLRERYASQIRTGFPHIPRCVSGYNLPALLPENGFQVARALVGSEGTCVTVLEATARLVHNPPQRALVVLGYADAYRAGDHVPQILEYQPIGLEGISGRMIDDMRRTGVELADVALLPSGGGWLLVEFGGETQAEADERAREMMARITRERDAPSMKLFSDPAQQHKIWVVRESALGVTADVPGEPRSWPGWEDSAVPPDTVGAYLRDLDKLETEYGYQGAFYGHFGQGCIHVRLDFDLVTAEGIKTFRAFMNDAADLVVSYGGSLSGEHGDGQARAELLPKMFSPELMEAFREFKAIWDPQNKMNPGKVVEPYALDQNLRLGTGYQPPVVRTHFQFPDDRGSFAAATTRCVGVGKCRRLGGGTMCPSFMVTREEEHSTRGRARLLFEMLQGNPLTGGWRSDAVREALDLCLACKGCKGDCPVNVDMATYKAEFLSHYYAGRLRPVTGYTMGLIYWWARLATHMPGPVNAITHTPLLDRVIKRLGGIAPQREVPRFAHQTFKDWFSKRGGSRAGGSPVILWPDTFNNHFFPDTAKAAVEVLEEAGCEVIVPEPSLCCGRPLYDYGFLDQAQALLRQILTVLRPMIREGVPVVVLEPSCASVFRDELTNLFPHDEDAQRLSKQTFLLSEFLEKKVESYQPPPLPRKAMVHGHCHHKAIMTMAEEQRVLEKLGLDVEILDSGCCGMAGAFGFERDHYDISVKVGERVLLPAVRNAAPDTLIITDGFSCREQIAQTTDRRALHLADVLRLALQEHGEVSPEAPAREAGRTMAPVTAMIAGAILGAVVLAERARRRSS